MNRVTLDRNQLASDAARVLLPDLARKYFGEGRQAVAHAQTPRELHRFRLKTKRFRYTLELFRPLYTEEFESRLKMLQEMQQILGRMSDAFTIRRLLKQDKALAKEMKRTGNAEMLRFRDHWNGIFDAAGEQEAWERTLAGVATR